MNIGLYVIGDEILSGKRQDKHLANVSSMLKDRGLQLSWVKILGDDLELLVNEFTSSFNSDDLVFSCGGIGGTPDDLTRNAAAKALNIAVELHPQGLQILESRADTFEGGLTEQRKLMVQFPVGSELIPNPVNQVPVFFLHNHYFVPGFPKMAQPMIQWVLNTRYPDFKNSEYTEWSVTLYDVPESNIADLMTEIQQQFDVKAYSLPRFVNDSFQIEMGLKGNFRIIDKARDYLQGRFKERSYHFD